MTDKKDQSNSNNPGPRFRALADGTGYKEGNIFVPVSREDHPKLTLKSDVHSFHTHFVLSGFMAPVFHKRDLEDSPDFELVEELWEPGEDGGLWGITSIMGQLQPEFIHPSERQRLAKYLKAEVGFRTNKDVNSFLSEFTELIKKRSKESRRLGNDRT